MKCETRGPKVHPANPSFATQARATSAGESTRNAGPRDATGRTSPESRGRGPSRPKRSVATTDGDFGELAATLRQELAPEGVLEGLLVDVVARAAWALRRDAGKPRRRVRDERALLRAFDALESLRARRTRPATPPRSMPSEPIESPGYEPLIDEDRLARFSRFEAAEAFDLGAPLDLEIGTDTSPAETTGPRESRGAEGQWRSHLVFEPEVSETSPVVRGTWITASRVVSLVVDGWTWADILRAHPELTEDDLRACLAYTIEQEEGFEPSGSR